MTEYIAWDKDETLLLVNLYIQTNHLQSDKTDSDINQLSYLLREYGKALGRPFDPAYRNFADIQSQLSGLVFLDTDSNYEKPYVTNLQKKIYKMYQQNVVSFMKNVNEARNHY